MENEAKVLKVSAHGRKSREQGMLQTSTLDSLMMHLTPAMKCSQQPPGARGKSQKPSPCSGKHRRLKKVQGKKVTNPGGDGRATRSPARGSGNCEIPDSTSWQPSSRLCKQRHPGATAGGQTPPSQRWVRTLPPTRLQLQKPWGRLSREALPSPAQRQALTGGDLANRVLGSVLGHPLPLGCATVTGVGAGSDTGELPCRESSRMGSCHGRLGALKIPLGGCFGRGGD